MLDHVISRDSAEALLNPHLDDIAAVLVAGWESWSALREWSPLQVALRRRTTRANWVYDGMVAKAHELFDDKSDVIVTESRGFLTVTFSNVVVLRFKKFRSSTLRTSGIWTHQRAVFEQQQLALPGFEVTTVVAGYLLDTLEISFERLAIVCPLGGSNLWTIDIGIPGESDASVVQLGKATPTSAPAAEVRSALVDGVLDEEKGS